jgi:hypothetical protein
VEKIKYIKKFRPHQKEKEKKNFDGKKKGKFKK